MKKLYILYSSIFFFIFGQNILPFRNTEDLNKYAKQHKEYPKIDNTNWLKPNYTSFYQKEQPTILQNKLNQILNILRIKRTLWDFNLFKNQLKKVKQVSNKKNYIVKLESNNSKFIVFTDISGAFHSLVRNLNKLIELNLLNKSLEILGDNYIIFNGNVLGNSPYILETFTVLLKLIDKNPNKVFFIAGNYEYKNNWQNFGIKKELILKSKTNILNKIPLEKELRTFLKSLPLAIYITDKNNKTTRISYFNRNFTRLNESFFANFLKQKQTKIIEEFSLKNTEKKPTKFNLNVILNGENKLSQNNNGLFTLLPEKGTISWGALSCPTDYGREVFNFLNDAFLIISPENQKISLYYQNAIKQPGYSYLEQNIFQQILGQQKIKTNGNLQKIATPKIVAKPDTKTKEGIIAPKEAETEIFEEISIGTTLDLSAELSENSKQVLNGLFLKINDTNSKGGINKQKINLIYMDDKFNPELARKNIQELINSGISTILCPMGSLQFKAYSHFMKDGKISVFFPEATSPEFRVATNKNVVHFFASVDREAQVLSEYMFENNYPNKIAIFYREEPFGIKAYEKTVEILHKHNFVKGRDWIAIPHSPSSVDVSEEAERIQRFIPDSIIFLTSSIHAKNLINNLGMNFLFNKKLYGLSSLSGKSFKTFIKNKNLKMINTQLTPSIDNLDIEIVKEFNELTTKNNIKPSSYLLEGYLAASLFLYYLEQISPPMTNEKIMTEIENTSKLNYKGLTLNFNPQKRELANTVWLDNDEEIITINN